MGGGEGGRGRGSNSLNGVKCSSHNIDGKGTEKRVSKEVNVYFWICQVFSFPPLTHLINHLVSDCVSE